MKWKHWCIHYSNDERLYLTEAQILFSTGYTGASQEQAPVQFCHTGTVSDCQWLLFGFRVTGCTGAAPAVQPVPMTFGAVYSQRLGVLLHSI